MKREDQVGTYASKIERLERRKKDLHKAVHLGSDTDCKEFILKLIGLATAAKNSKKRMIKSLETSYTDPRSASTQRP